LPQGSYVAFDVLEDLQYWNGTGAGASGPVPNGEKLRIKLGGQNRYVGTGTGFQTAFNMATVGAGGVVHVHPSKFMWGDDGNAVPAAGRRRPRRALSADVRVRSSDAAISSSAPLYSCSARVEAAFNARR
jgi:hypothetical protein